MKFPEKCNFKEVEVKEDLLYLFATTTHILRSAMLKEVNKNDNKGAYGI